MDQIAQTTASLPVVWLKFSRTSTTLHHQGHYWGSTGDCWAATWSLATAFHSPCGSAQRSHRCWSLQWCRAWLGFRCMPTYVSTWSKTGPQLLLQARWWRPRYRYDPNSYFWNFQGQISPELPQVESLIDQQTATQPRWLDLDLRPRSSSTTACRNHQAVVF